MDALSSLSRLMRHGAGPGRTRADHLDAAAQLLAALSRARRVGSLADLVGSGALSEVDRAYLDLQTRFEPRRPARGRAARARRHARPGVAGAAGVARSELGMLPAALLDEHAG